MTNAEKFKEVFGRALDLNECESCIFECPKNCVDCVGCEKYEDGDFWHKEYKEQKNDNNGTD